MQPKTNKYEVLNKKNNQQSEEEDLSGVACDGVWAEFKTSSRCFPNTQTPPTERFAASCNLKGQGRRPHRFRLENGTGPNKRFN